MKLRHRVADWLMGGELAKAKSEAIHWKTRTQRCSTRNAGLEEAILNINPTRPEGGHPDGRIFERHHYRGGTIRDTALPSQRVFFPGTEIEAMVDAEGNLELTKKGRQVLGVRADGASAMAHLGALTDPIPAPTLEG